MGAQLSSEERNLVSVAYKNKTGTLRNSWRAVDTLEKREAQSSRTSRRLTLMRKARGDIERELERACQDVLNLISAHLLPAASPGEERVFYHKMYVLATFFTQFCSSSTIILGRGTTTVTYMSSRQSRNANGMALCLLRRIKPLTSMRWEHSNRGILRVSALH